MKQPTEINWYALMREALAVPPTTCPTEEEIEDAVRDITLPSSVMTEEEMNALDAFFILDK